MRTRCSRRRRRGPPIGALVVALLVAMLGAPFVGRGEIGWPRAMAFTSVLRAQEANDGAQLLIAIPDGARPLTVRLVGAIGAREYDELLRNGFDVRVHLRAELWKVGRWFDDLDDRTEWDLVVHYDQLDRTYEVLRLLPDGRVTPLGSYGRLADATTALSLPYVPRLRAPTSGARWYYTVRADISVLEFGDVDEVRRWLGGELEPAVRGQRNAGTALTRGVQALVSRLLGGSVRRLEARTSRFRVRAAESPE